MRNLIRSPLTWLVLAELAVVGALSLVAWNVIASAARPVPPMQAVQEPDGTADASPPLPQLPDLNPPAWRGPLPGLNVDASFWHQRLAELNGDQVDLEQLEWRIIHSAEDAVDQYLQTVVLPSVRRAEKQGAEAAGGELAA